MLSIFFILFSFTFFTTKICKAEEIDSNSPSLQVNYTIRSKVATVIVEANDNESGIKRILYLKGDIREKSSRWEKLGKDITNTLAFEVSTFGEYTVMVEDMAGNKTLQLISIETEFNAVWISYLEFNDRLKDPATGIVGFTKERFEAMIDEMFDHVVELHMNAVVVHVRPFGDAMYPSEYFPWSKYITGTQGKDPGFDPLEYMVQAAHKRDLEFHAWINPYRVSNNTINITTLAKSNIARKWLTDNYPLNDRNILPYGGALYYNPSSARVQAQIVNGIKEIVENYDVDGIHFDDYFYPSLGANYANNFDSAEYKEYVKEYKAIGNIPKTIADWRRNNVNKLIKKVYTAIKEIDDSVQFGISPGGFLDYLLRDDGYYCDVKTWLSKPGYIDYICPQLYWSFSNSIYPYDKILDRWLSLRTNEDIKVYVGIATYKAGSSEDPIWKNNADVLMNQIEYGRKTGLVSGYIYFRYDYFYKNATQPGVKKLLGIL